MTSEHDPHRCVECVNDPRVCSGCMFTQFRMACVQAKAARELGRIFHSHSPNLAGRDYLAESKTWELKARAALLHAIMLGFDVSTSGVATYWHNKWAAREEQS